VRILASADIHGIPDYVDAVVRWALEREPDAVVLAGDLLRPLPGAASLEERFRADARRLAEAFDPFPGPVWYVMGNDDLIDWEPPQERFTSLHGRRIERDGVNFVGYQYTLPLLGLPFEKTEEEIAADLEALAPLVDQATVLVTHGPAKGVHDIPDSFAPPGIASLARLIEERKPRAHVHGHIHSLFGRTGIHFDVACREVARAMLIDLETMTHEIVSD
jgi:Icc-related predicted phosphoesterase